MRVLDAFAKVMVNAHRAKSVSDPHGVGRRILLCKYDHLGDLVLFLQVLPRIREACPKDELHLVVGSWALELVENNPYVDRVCVYDHARLNRSGRYMRRLYRWFSTGRSLVRLMRSERYDIACDFRAYPPVMSPLLFAGAIRWRVGFSSGGFGPLYHQVVPWHEGRYEADHLFDIAAALGPVRREIDPGALDYLISQGAEPVIEGIPERSRVAVINPFGGAGSKKWPAANWQVMIDYLVSEGMIPVVVGRTAGADAQVYARFSGAVNAVNRTSIRSLAALVRRASLVVSVDSFAAQLAVALNRPAAVLMAGIEKPSAWYPVRANVAVVTKSVPCAPCFRPCADLECMNISPESVKAACRSLLD